MKPQNSEPPIVYMLCGLTGSGKSTYSKRLESEQRIPRFSLDETYFALMGNKRPEHHDYEIENQAEEQIIAEMKQLLASGQSLILDHGFWKKANRDKYRQLIKESGGMPELIYFKVPKQELLRRLAERNKTARVGTHIISPELLDTFYERFEEPSGEDEKVIEYKVWLMPDTHILRVFIDSNSNYGDLASVVIDEGRHIPDTERQAIARKLNTGETLFINDLAKADVSVMHPQGEIGFAGVGVLGGAWLLSKLNGSPINAMYSRDGKIKVWQDGELTWAQANLSIMPPWNYRQLESPEAVERITLEETESLEHTMIWAWIDEAKGLIRARTFATDWDIPEAQGNGSGSMVLAAQLNRKIEIKHGLGAVIFADPAADGYVNVGGRIAEV